MTVWSTCCTVLINVTEICLHGTERNHYTNNGAVILMFFSFWIYAPKTDVFTGGKSFIQPEYHACIMIEDKIKVTLIQ